MGISMLLGVNEAYWIPHHSFTPKFLCLGKRDLRGAFSLASPDARQMRIWSKAAGVLVIGQGDQAEVYGLVQVLLFCNRSSHSTQHNFCDSSFVGEFL